MALRKRTWAALITLLLMVLGVVTTYVVVTNTDAGRARLARFTLTRLNRVFGGRATVHIERLVDIGAQHIVAERVSLVDTAGVPVVTIAHLKVLFSVRALFSKAILLRELNARGVQVELRKDFEGPWNIAYIITGDTMPKRRTGPGFGDDVQVERLTLTDAVITTIAPWSPPPLLTGRARDSAIVVRDSLHDIVRTPLGLLERRRYEFPRAVAHEAVFTRRDRSPASMQIDSLVGIIADPPVRITQARGEITWTGDSLKLQLADVRLPASAGSATGKVWWNEPGPLRYDVIVKARASLSDLQWIWALLPEKGGGNALVRLRTLQDADSTEYALDDLDVESEGSHITGKITVLATPYDLGLTGVDLTFAPLQSGLMRRLSYDLVPPEVRGTLRGRLVAATGGSLRNLLIDRIDARFDDATIPGAFSTLNGGGRISLGADPFARNFSVSSARVDLRSLKTLMPTLPAELDGVVEASGLIASADLRQVDLRNAAATWRDAAGNVSTVRGNAQVAYASRTPSINANLVFDPISMLALARIDSTVPLRGTLAGNLRAQGPFDALRWEASLRADSASRIAMSGTASLGTANWHVVGEGAISSFDASSWLGRTDVPVTALTGTVRIDAQGGKDSAGVGGIRELRGNLQLKQVAAADRPGFDLLSSISLDDKRLHIDSATARMGGLLLSASGSLARDSLSNNRSALDTIKFSFDAESLGAARPDLMRLSRMWARVDTATAATIRGLVDDSLDGTAVGSGYLYGSLQSYGATFSFGGRDLRLANIRVGGLFGSALVNDLPGKPTFETAATATNVDGLGAIRIATAEFRIGDADPARGSILLNVAALDTSQLSIRGEYQRRPDSLIVALDTFRFNYHDVRWTNRGQIRVYDTPDGQRIDSLLLTSNEGGLFSASGYLPYSGPVRANIALNRFPVGEIYAFAMAKTPFSGLVSGEASASGTRAAPLLEWQLRADSLGASGFYLPQVTSDGAYQNRRLVARAMLADTLGGSLSAEARVPIDLSFGTVAKRLLSDSVDADITATQLRLGALGVTYTGVDRINGMLDGRLQLAGTIERPFARGEMAIDGFSARNVELGIEPVEGRMVVRAVQDSLILDELRFRSGNMRGDTVSARGALRFAFGEPATMRLNVFSNGAVLARQRDGTLVIAGGDLTATGRVSRPEITGRVVVPIANIIADPLGASTALDLNSQAARELLGTDEVPVAETATQSLARLGRFVSVNNVVVQLGDEVWVRTPEATVRISGAVSIVSAGETIAPEGELTASRGVYRLNLGVVNRSFSIDSGRVRFYGNNAIPATVDISATNVVRSTGSSQIPVRVHIGGTLEVPVLTLSSPDPLYSGAPDSEIISLLIFGAPTFALDGRSQSTVRAVTGVFLPSVGGAVEGTLQRLLRVNTVQVNTAGGQQDDLTRFSLLDNLSITAGKQLGDKTFLRANAGVCRGAGAASSAGVTLWGGVAVEYQLKPHLTAQIGVDPGAAPCSRLGGDVMPKLQFGFDLFREWIF